MDGEDEEARCIEDHLCCLFSFSADSKVDAKYSAMSLVCLLDHVSPMERWQKESG